MTRTTAGRARRIRPCSAGRCATAIDSALGVNPDPRYRPTSIRVAGSVVEQPTPTAAVARIVDDMNERMGEEQAVRASDAERAKYTTMVTDAVGDGRLTVDEADDRMERIYATRFRHELRELVADLPGEDRRVSRTMVMRAPVRFRVHVAVAVAISVLLIVRWVASGVPFFWPAGPMFLLWATVFVHARVAGIRRPGGRARMS